MIDLAALKTESDRLTQWIESQPDKSTIHCIDVKVVHHHVLDILKGKRIDKVNTLRAIDQAIRSVPASVSSGDHR